MREYYKPNEDDLSSIGFSATQTIQDGTTTHIPAQTSRPTLGELQGKVIQTQHPPPNTASTHSSTIPPPSSVFTPVIVQPSDAQTTASSVTFGSILTDMDRRQAQRDAKQAQLFETMIQMMTKITNPPDPNDPKASQSPPLEGAGTKP